MVASIDHTIASSYLKAASGCVAHICAPLQSRFGIKAFGYLKILRDSRYLLLMNGWHEFSEQYLSAVSTLNSGFTERILNDYRTKNQKYFCWPTTLTSRDQILELAYENNLWHGMSICQQPEDHFEIVCFCFDINSGPQHDFFINNLQTLDEFLGYFKSVGTNLINPTDKKVFAVYKTPLNPALFLPKVQTIIPGPFSNTGKVSCGFGCTVTNFQISKREQDCLALIKIGKTAKEIACTLDLSPRTVEEYINNLKRKTGCAYKTQLIEIAQTYGFNRTG